MKIKILKYLTPVLLVFGVFILPKITLAATIIQQTNFSTESNNITAQTQTAIVDVPFGTSGTFGKITIKLDTTTTHGCHQLQLRESTTLHGAATNSWFSSISTAVSGLQTYEFTFSGVTMNGSKYYRWENDAVSGGSSGCSGTSGWPTYKIAGLNSGTQYCWDPYTGTLCGSVHDAYYIIEDGIAAPPANMSIDVPGNDAFLSIATSTVVSGKCLNIGSNILELTATPFLGRSDPDSKYNITCNSDYTWTSSFTALNGINTLWLVDKSAQNENPPDIFNTLRYASMQYTGYSGSLNGLSWLLTLEYPPDNGSHFFTINPNVSQQFRFRFKVPDDGVKASSRIKTILWTDSSRTVASTTNEFIGLDSLDLDGDGLLGLNVGPVPDNQKWYYTEYLKYSSTTMYSIPFTVYASSTAQSAGTSVNPNAPDDRQYGPCLNLPLIGLSNFCFGTMFYALVIPNPRFMKDDVNDTYQLMQTKIPFVFYYQLKDQLRGVTATSTDFTYNIPVTLASSTGISLTIPFSSNNSGVHNVRSALDPWFKAFAWFFFAWWAYWKAITFHF